MRFAPFVIVLLVLSSCFEGLQRFPEPDDLIPREKMIEIMTDMIKLEGYVQDRWPGVNRYSKTMVRSGDSLLKTYGVTWEQYEASMNYYGSRQDEMQSMYSEVLENLGQEVGELQSGDKN